MNITRTEMLHLTRIALQEAHISPDSRLGKGLLEEAGRMKVVAPFHWWDFENHAGCLVGSYRLRRGKFCCPFPIGKQARVGWWFQEVFRGRYGPVKGPIAITDATITDADELYDELYVPEGWVQPRIPTSV